MSTRRKDVKNAEKEDITEGGVHMVDHEDVGTTKYVIHAHIEANGVIERPDVVGAIFGQTEGLLGEELDLRELQKTGRIGRIKVSISSQAGKSTGTIIVPSSMDRVETAILAAALETIDRVGPCEAKITVDKIEYLRATKRKMIVERAKEILSRMIDEMSEESHEITEEVMKSVRLGEIEKYGPEGLPAGPSVKDSDAIIIVEGRADVLNLLKYGIRNTIAVEGTSIPESIIKLSKEKTTIAFLDGDRGGDLILKELLQVAEIDFVARAPGGKEVEELTKKEVIKALRNKIPVEQVVAAGIPSETASVPSPAVNMEKSMQKVGQRRVSQERHVNRELDMFKGFLNKLPGTLSAYLLDENMEVLDKVAVRDLAETLRETGNKNIYAVVFDGVITQRLVDIASEKGISYLVGMKSHKITRRPVSLKILSLSEG